MGAVKENRAQEMVDAAVDENVVDAEGALRPEDSRHVRPGLGDEESPGLEHEESGVGQPARARLPRNPPQPLSKKSEIQRSLSVGIGHAEASAEIDGSKRDRIFLRK